MDKRWRLLRVRTERQIDATPEAVWGVISDHATWTSWHEDYDEHAALTDQVSQVCYRVVFTGTWTFWLLSVYTVGQLLGSIYFDARSSLMKLERHVAECSQA